MSLSTCKQCGLQITDKKHPAGFCCQECLDLWEATKEMEIAEADRALRKAGL